MSLKHEAKRDPAYLRRLQDTFRPGRRVALKKNLSVRGTVVERPEKLNEYRADRAVWIYFDGGACAVCEDTIELTHIS